MYRVSVQQGKEKPSFIAYQGEDSNTASVHMQTHWGEKCTSEIVLSKWNPGNGSQKRGWETCVLWKRYRDW